MPTDEQEEQIPDGDLSFTSPSVVIATESNVESVSRNPIVKLVFSSPYVRHKAKAMSRLSGSQNA